MDLWTEYEGLTVDGSFPLKKLLQPEGRSAFFATSNAQGEAILIRLIECHFDEEEILARWRGVQALGHPDFLRIDRFGQLVIDETTVVYAAFEHVETDLATVLDEGSLSAADAAQIGTSLVSALETLHAHGFVHEHVEARNVFAVGETVKLRSDCIRETPEGEAGVEARRRDVQDLAALLKHVLLGTRRFKRVQMPPPLPAPFEEIVRNGLSGAWGLKEIGAALTPKKAMGAAIPVAAVPMTLGPVAAIPVTPGPEKPAAVAATPEEKPFSFKKKPEPVQREKLNAAPKPEHVAKVGHVDKSRGSGFDLKEWIRDSLNQGRRWLLAAGLAVVVLLIGILALRAMLRSPETTQSAVTAEKVTAPPKEVPAAPSPRAEARPAETGSRSTALAGHGGARTEWRVVAFTYNQESQARKKASSLGQSHPDLRPEAFSPTGGAPWLVTVGGAMQRDEAYALAREARSLGLPHDTYAQNYTAR
jgi:hypothetical protein